MLPLFVYIMVIGASLPCSCVNGIDAEHQAAYDRVVGCISKDTHADQPGHDLPFETVICDAFKVMGLCITEPFNSGASHSSEILDFYRAYQLQRIILTRKSNLCKEPLPYEKLKELVIKSDAEYEFVGMGNRHIPTKCIALGTWDQPGIMDRENLPSIENDTYAECAGVVERKCIEVAVDGWEHHSNILNVVLAYINCYDEETKTCDAPIARQINIVIQAFKKHLQENHGLLGAMIDKIDH